MKQNEKMINPVKRIKRCPVERIQNSIEVRQADEIHPVRNVWVSSHYDYSRRCNYHIASSTCRYVTEFLKDDHKYWKPGSIVFLEASTGAGKTTYLKSLIDSGYRVLYLTNRRANRQQVIASYGGDNFDENYIFNSLVISYQKLEKDPAMTSQFIDSFDLVFLDEVHYFNMDGIFNSSANLSLKKIMGAVNTRKVFMSATISDFFQLILYNYISSWTDLDRMTKLHYYKMDMNHQIIRNIVNIPNEEVLLDQIEQDCDKYLIFVDNIAKGKELTNSLQQRNIDVVFISSETSKISKKETEVFTRLVAEKKFDQQVLVCTSVLDNGLEIFDRSLRKIVLYDNSKIELKQELGRRRSYDGTDWVDVLIMDISQKKLLNKKKAILDLIDKMRNVHSILLGYRKPPQEIMQNNNFGNEVRNAMYYEFETGRFYTNQLGLNQLFNSIRDLNELIESDSVFNTKVAWLREDTKLNIRGSIIEDTDRIKAEVFTKKIREFLPIQFAKRDPSYKDLQELFTRLCFEVMGIDKSRGQRSNRLLSLNNIEEIIQDYDLPLKIYRNSKGMMALDFIEERRG